MFCNCTTFTKVVALGIFLFAILSIYRFFKSNPSLPPGPKGLPFIGNALDMPTQKEWLKFAQWGEIFGDICSVTVLGQPLIILNSAQAAIDMLDKKSAIYSDRPVLQMGGELVGWKNTLVLLPYGDRFRRYRRLFYRLIGTHASVKRFHPSSELEARAFLRRLVVSPEQLANHVRYTAGANILRISHGYEVQPHCDPFVNIADEATEQFSLATAPGGFLVDLIPALRHLPCWFPGAGFQLTARNWSSTLQEMVDAPFNFVKEQMAAGTACVSFCSTLLESKVLNAEEEFDLKWCAASLYSGMVASCATIKEWTWTIASVPANDSVKTVSALYSFFLGIALHSDVLAKAQEEIDRVVGKERLPTFADRPHLPYINALVLEVLRWHTVTPTAVPHRAMQDDIHDGFFIPKGALVIPNVWKITHDPLIYSHPFEFNPARFLETDKKQPERDPRDFCFGFGRRSVEINLCQTFQANTSCIPGLAQARRFPWCFLRYTLTTSPLGSRLADSSIYITCATVLAVFDIKKAIENGTVVEPVHDYTQGTIRWVIHPSITYPITVSTIEFSHPKPFRCSILPRSQKALSLILSQPETS
ncbi:hypothetical protein CVT24_001997 [Panaeolus cyanescens]|uniref:Cytochrome P450 n=1 Tax=Panaeolus cyanescens TaxID=181874 RepID=A0A409YHG9_9AGAR|nr:hypothetical protein CVT24_001997 [Panaeolus cyanescens]